MKILAIATICPVPDVLEENDVILEFYYRLQKMYPNVEVKVLKPVIYATDTMAKVKPSLKPLCEARKLRQFKAHGFSVLAVPFFYLSSNSRIYHMLAKTILPMNRAKIVEFLDGFDFDFIQAHFINMDGELARQLSLASGRPYLLSTQREAYRFVNKVEVANARRIIESATAVTSLSPYAAQKISETTGRISQVIPYGINDSFFNNTPGARSGLLRKGRLITVGRLIELKNIDVVIEAIYNLRNEYEFEYTIIGDGPERERLEGVVLRLGLQEKVSFLGYLEKKEIRERLRGSDLFVLPSAPETYGLVYGEAMACGLPIVCARNNGFCGHFEEGVCGYSVAPRDVESLGVVLAKLFSEPGVLSEMSVAAAEHAKSFTWRQCCESYMGLFEDVIGVG